MSAISMEITISFREGADIPDEAYRFRKVLNENNLSISDERYSKNTVTFVVDITEGSSTAISEIIKNKDFDVDSAVMDMHINKKDVRIPFLGKVSS